MRKKHGLERCGQLGLIGLLGWLGAIATASHTFAQSKIVPDNTLGAESSQVIPRYQGLPIEIITGGASRGVNLFHSFQEFNVSAQRGAYFLTPDANIQNILARVTGGKLSEIFGTLGVGQIINGNIARNNANLFIINPIGIIFGPNARLDLGGSFVATTANAVQFGEQGFFRATTPNSVQPILTVNPSALLFNQINQGITSQSGMDGLKVADGRSILLVGGNVNLDSAFVQAPGGRVELGGVSGVGTVGLNMDGNNLRLNFPENVAKADVSLNQATVDVGGVSSAGSVQVQGDRVTLTNGSSILNSNISGNQSSGDIFIRASQLNFAGNSIINTINAGVSKGIDVTIKTDSLNLQDNSSINTGSLFAPGKAGNITIEATDAVNLNQSRFGTISVGTGDETTTGAGGNISIKTQNLSLKNMSGIAATTFLGTGNAGQLSIQAANSINLDNSVFSAASLGAGTGGDILIDTRNLRLQNDSAIFTNTFNPRNLDISSLFQFPNLNFDPSLLVAINALIANINPENVGNSNSGNVIINASNSVEIFSRLTNGSLSAISTGTFGAGNGGNITISTGQLRLFEGGGISTGSSLGSQGNSGNVIINASNSVEINGNVSGVSTDTFGAGNGGNITISTGQLRVLGVISTGTGIGSPGKGGNVVINAANAVEFSGKGDGLSTLTQGSGSAGDITIETGRLIVQDGADILAATFGQGVGGNIQLKANLLSLDRQAIVSSRSLGQARAGNISISLRDTLQTNNSDITTNAAQAGGGNISITAKDIRLRNNSDIRTDLSRGQGSGGNIFLSANSIIALEDSDILAFAPEGQGGNITFNTRVFLSAPLYQVTQTRTDAATLQALDGNGRVDVNASGAVSGSITGVPDITFLQNSFSELSTSLIDANALIANSCIVRRNNRLESTFMRTGKGNLPVRPGDAPLSPYTISTVRSIPTGSENSSTPITLNRLGQIGDAKPYRIVEPDGVYRLPNGQLVLSRKCP